MEGKFESRDDFEAMLRGLTPAERERVIDGAIRDIDADLERRGARNRELLERLLYIRSFDGEDPARDKDATEAWQPRGQDWGV